MHQKCYKDVLPAVAMVAFECSNVLLNVLFKAASSKGLTYFIYLAYSYALATLCFLPLAIFLIRKSGLPPFNFPLISTLCLLGLLGFSLQLCAYRGLKLGTPTLSSAINNLIPAFTFMFAVLFRDHVQSHHHIKNRRGLGFYKTWGALGPLSDIHGSATGGWWHRKFNA